MNEKKIPSLSGILPLFFITLVFFAILGTIIKNYMPIGIDGLGQIDKDSELYKSGILSLLLLTGGGFAFHFHLKLLDKLNSYEVPEPLKKSRTALLFYIIILSMAAVPIVFIIPSLGPAYTILIAGLIIAEVIIGTYDKVI